MNVLIAVESAFGCTRAVADAVAAGLRSAGADVTVLDAASADPEALPGLGLLLVGAPTHNLGLPTPTSREQAAKRGAQAPASGVAEWLDVLPRLDGLRAAAFDTAVPGAFSGSAAKKIARKLRGLRAQVDSTRSFTVTGSPATLADGELARAEAWGAALAVAGAR